ALVVQRLPQPGALLEGDVQLPPELADVGDARGDDDLRADLDLAAGAELEGVVRQVVARDALEDVAGSRAPEPDRRPRVRLVDDLRGAVGRNVVGEPLAVD